VNNIAASRHLVGDFATIAALNMTVVVELSAASFVSNDRPIG